MTLKKSSFTDKLLKCLYARVHNVGVVQQNFTMVFMPWRQCQDSFLVLWALPENIRGWFMSEGVRVALEIAIII